VWPRGSLNERSGNTFEQPQSQFVLSRVVTFDGVAGDWRASNPGADFQLATFTYDGGFHDRRERDFRGNARVVATTHDTRGLTGGVPADFSRPYLRTTRTYLTDSFFTKGLMTSEGFEGLDTGAPRTFAETSHSYALREVDTQRVLTSPATITETLPSLPRAAHDDPAPRRRQREHGDPEVYAELDRVMVMIVRATKPRVRSMTVEPGSRRRGSAAHLQLVAERVRVAISGGSPS
jgi:hypothetical protein